MGGMGDIGGGCWIEFDLDEIRIGDRRKHVEDIDRPGWSTGSPKRVFVTFPHAPRLVSAQGSTRRYRIVLARDRRIGVDWDHLPESAPPPPQRPTRVRGKARPRPRQRKSKPRGRRRHR